VGLFLAAAEVFFHGPFYRVFFAPLVTKQNKTQAKTNQEIGTPKPKQKQIHGPRRVCRI
jgi:hypothetical protein